jgi:hypothetical protein
MSQENSEKKMLQQRFEFILKNAKLGESAGPKGSAFGFANVTQMFTEGMVILNKNDDQVIVVRDEERKYFFDNKGSCLKRAEGTLIKSLGKKRGYSFIQSTDIPSDGQGLINQALSPENEQKRNTEISSSELSSAPLPKESFLHFPFTVVLTDHFEKKSEYPFIWSLPAKIGNVGVNSNPDAIMLRKNPRKYRYSTGLEASGLANRQIEDITNKFMPSTLPDLSCASMEFKVFSDVNSGTTRKNMMQAITETQLNSSWANESWLVFYMVDRDEPVEIEHDLERFANSLGIGILQVYVRRGSVSELAVHTHVSANQREYIDISPNQSMLYYSLSEAVDEYGRFESNNATDIAIGSQIFKQSIRNLSIQTGFKNSTEPDFDKCWKKLKSEGFEPVIAAIKEFFSDDFPIQDIKNWITNNETLVTIKGLRFEQIFALLDEATQNGEVANEVIRKNNRQRRVA